MLATAQPSPIIHFQGELCGWASCPGNRYLLPGPVAAVKVYSSTMGNGLVYKTPRPFSKAGGREGATPLSPQSVRRVPGAFSRAQLNGVW